MTKLEHTIRMSLLEEIYNDLSREKSCKVAAQLVLKKATTLDMMFSQKQNKGR